MKIIGRNAVKEAISSEKTIDRLIVERDLKDTGSNNIINMAKSRGIKINFVNKAVLDRESAGVKHQGFVAEITDYKYSTAEDILEFAESKGEPPFVVIIDGVEDPHNLGSIIRVAECAGVHGIIIPRHRAVSVNDTVVRVSSGAASHMRVARVTNINETIKEFKNRNIFVFAAELGGESIYKTSLTGAIAIVVGGEDSGVKKLTKDLCDGIVSLPMFGKVNSLNASVACGAVLYEAIRQRNTTTG